MNSLACILSSKGRYGMIADDRLTEIFDRGLKHGSDALSAAERKLFLIQEFIIEYEMSGLSGYFYNRLPDLSRILATVAAMSEHGLTELASLLDEAADLFRGYSDSSKQTTWNEVLQLYDPENRLRQLDRRIAALENYGLSESSIN